MSGLPFGLIVESVVAVLLLLTIGYCMVLNERLKRLHADRNALKEMVLDLVRSTEMAENSIKGLKQTAEQAEQTLGAKLNEADRFAVQLANHISAGQSVLERIARITDAAKKSEPLREVPQASPAAKALARLRAHQTSKGQAA